MGVTERKSQSLQVVVPTVRGREDWLDECLRSITSQIRHPSVSLKVSGNATSQKSQEIAEANGARFIKRDSRLSAEEHVKCLVRESRTEASYFWLIADDDVMAPGALNLVTDLIGIGVRKFDPPTAIIGRARYFQEDALNGLKEPVPHDKVWHPGKYLSLEEIGYATKGVARIGAFVFQAALIQEGDLQRYDGTSHGFFGGFWDGLATSNDLSVVVSGEPLVFLRDARKEWDESRVATLLGRRNFEDLLPPEILTHVERGNRRLTRRTSLKLASTARRGERALLKQLLDTYASAESGARWLASIPKVVARTLFPVSSSVKAFADFLYLRFLRR